MIHRCKLLLRLLHINFILARHGLDKIILSLHLFAPLRFLIYLNPWNWFRSHTYQRGIAIREALEELGPIFVKFGQALSTRKDLLPDDIARELEKLQDKVPPFASEKVQQIIEQSFRCSLSELFSSFDLTALASASVAQVHAATLHSGEDVVVKVIRPNIEKMIERDVDLLYFLARLVERYLTDGPRLKPTEVVAEFDQTLHDELDLYREAANASQLRRYFNDSDLLYVPEVHWEYVKENIMVMERIYGIPISNVEELKRQNTDLKKLADIGVKIFFTQVFRDSFFHADMHPGNIFVNVDDPKNPRYLCVDFGIMGTLDLNDKRYLAENFHAFFHRDYQRVAELHVESGWVPHTVRIPDFEAAIRTVCEPIFERPLSDISIATMLLRLFQTGRRFDMEVQPQLVLLQKTLFAIEGLGRQLYPQLDLWATAKPFLEDYLRDQMGPGAIFKKIRSHFPYWMEKLPDLPERLDSILRLSNQALLLQQQATQKPPMGPKRNPYKVVAYAVGGGLLLTSALISLSHSLPALKNTDAHTLSAGIFILGLITFALSILIGE